MGDGALLHCDNCSRDLSEEEIVHSMETVHGKQVDGMCEECGHVVERLGPAVDSSHNGEMPEFTSIIVEKCGLEEYNNDGLEEQG